MIVLASSHVAWAGPAPSSEPSLVERSDVQSISSGYKGTVRPPNCGGINVTETGSYSVCGVAVLNVEFTTNKDVHVLAAPSSYIPPGAGKVMTNPVVIGCLLEGTSHPGPHDDHANIKLCFAAHPKNKSEIKYFNEATKTWTSLETTIENGQACAVTSYSGTYVLVKK